MNKNKVCRTKAGLGETCAQHIIADAKKQKGLLLFKYFCPNCNAWHLTRRPNNYRKHFFFVQRGQEVLKISNKEYQYQKDDTLITAEKYKELINANNS